MNFFLKLIKMRFAQDFKGFFVSHRFILKHFRKQFFFYQKVTNFADYSELFFYYDLKNYKKAYACLSYM